MPENTLPIRQTCCIFRHVTAEREENTESLANVNRTRIEIKHAARKTDASSITSVGPDTRSPHSVLGHLSFAWVHCRVNRSGVAGALGQSPALCPTSPSSSRCRRASLSYSSHGQTLPCASLPLSFLPLALGTPTKGSLPARV
jgi:hypothetical protein